MQSNIYQVEKEIDGVKYVGQYTGLRTYLKVSDDSRRADGNGINTEDYYDNALKAAIIEPANLSVDDFDDIDHLKNVIDFANEVMEGKFRANTEQGKDKAKGKE